MNRPSRKAAPLFWWIALASVVSLAVWVLLDQLSWHLRARPSDYLSTLGTVSTAMTTIVSAIAAGGVMVYVLLTYRLWEEARQTNVTAAKTSEATLMSQLMTEYDGMRDAVQAINDFYDAYPEREQAIAAFRAARDQTDRNNAVLRQVDPSRFRLSRYFVRLRKLSNAGYLSRRIIFVALNRAAIEDVFLARVDPLDQVIASRKHGRPNVVDRDFYQQLLADRASLDP